MSKKGKTSPSKAEVDALFERWMEDAPTDEHLRRSAHMRAQRNAPAFNTLLSSALKQACGTDAARGRNKATQKKVWADEELRATQTAKQKQVWSDSDLLNKHKNKLKCTMSSAAMRAKVSATTKLAMQSPEILKKMRKPRSEQTCPHCNHVGRGGIMKRWHFDNCKHKP